jgi:hypothetical protein
MHQFLSLSLKILHVPIRRYTHGHTPQIRHTQQYGYRAALPRRRKFRNSPRLYTYDTFIVFIKGILIRVR